MAASNRSRIAVVAAILALPALAACDAIIGLSDFKKGECSGGDACLDTIDSGVANPDASDSGSLDAGSEGGRGAQPVSWANWPMPNYSGAEGGVDAGYVTHSDGTVTDNVTTLVWQVKPTLGLTYDQATAACTAPFRLPKRIELVTLLDYSHSAPFIDPTSFGVSFPFVSGWTSSEVRIPGTGNGPATVTSSFWLVNFGTGQVEQADASKAAGAALCVKDAK